MRRFPIPPGKNLAHAHPSESDCPQAGVHADVMGDPMCTRDPQGCSHTL